MATTRKQTRSKREPADSGTAQNGREVSSYEQELADYLQERIKPGLNRGSIPLLARSIAKEIAQRSPQEEADVDDEYIDDDERTAEADDDYDDEADDEPTGEADDDDEDEDEPTGEADDDSDDDESAEDESPPDFEAGMHELQAELGEDWILRFSVQGEDSWLTAEKDDGSQRVEAPTAAVLSEVVELLDESGGRST
jgi:hypothetical protein